MKHYIKRPALCAAAFIMAFNMLLTGCGSSDTDDSSAAGITASQSSEEAEGTTTSAGTAEEETSASSDSTGTESESTGTESEGISSNNTDSSATVTTAKDGTQAGTGNSSGSSAKSAGTAVTSSTQGGKSTSGGGTSATTKKAAVTTSVSGSSKSGGSTTTTTTKKAAVTPAAEVEALDIPYIEGTSDNDGFIRGMDVSTVLALYESWKHADGSAHFKDLSGKELDIQGFFDLLYDSGTNYIRLRVWNDPFDSSGNGYGGGNIDIDAAVTMGRYAAKAGMKVLIDFHYSDFWADPGKQQCPKAWQGMSIDEKADALYKYTASSLKKLKDAGVNIGMVQIGNETTGRFCGETNWDNICTLFSAGAKAVREADKSILIAVHFTNPQKASNYKTYAKQLNSHGVDYDVFASSWYPYWHGTLANLTSVLKDVSDTYGKKVMVAETAWAHTYNDGDGYGNTVTKSSNSSSGYEVSAQGQADLICDVAKAVKAVGKNGLGMFYWEPAWLPVQVYGGSSKVYTENKTLWEKYGAGWATSYSAEFDPDDAGKWYGGSAWDNQALFDFDGTPLASLWTYKYMQTK